MRISRLSCLVMGLLGLAAIPLVSSAVANASPALSASSNATSPLPLTVSGNNGNGSVSPSDLQTVNNQLETLNQQTAQQQNELSLLQQRVLQLEAQNELSRSRLASEASEVLSSSSTASDASVIQSSSPPTTISTPTSGVGSSPAAIASADSSESSALYAKAYEFINQGEYKKAETALNAYLAADPKGENASDAHYWLGEINMVNAESDVAAKEFRIVIESFPNSPRAPSAMRELGEIFLANGDSQHAKQTLKMVIQKYPDTAAAVLAQKTLETM